MRRRQLCLQSPRFHMAVSPMHFPFHSSEGRPAGSAASNQVSMPPRGVPGNVRNKSWVVTASTLCCSCCAERPCFKLRSPFGSRDPHRWRSAAAAGAGSRWHLGLAGASWTAPGAATAAPRSHAALQGAGCPAGHDSRVQDEGFITHGSTVRNSSLGSPHGGFSL